MKKIFFALIASFAAMLLSGCGGTKSREESNIPWARPASWEGGAPGMGGVIGQQGRTGY